MTGFCQLSVFLYTNARTRIQLVLATAFENCPDILKVDWEMY